jgi:rod shape-determining protein MreB and related proteins
MASLFKVLGALLSGGPYYVRLRRNRIHIRDAKGQRQFEDEPLVALTDEDPPRIEAIGVAARRSKRRIVNPFSHPRVIVDDYAVAEKLLQHAFKMVSPRTLIRASPIAVMHWLDELEGGLTPIERRVLHELGEGAGARRVYVWEGRELTNEELRSGAYRAAT